MRLPSARARLFGLASAAFVATALLAQPPRGSAELDKAAVQEVFEAYKAALLAGDGAAAAELVDHETRSYWHEIRDLAMTGDRSAIEARPFVDRLLIISMRHEVPADELGVMELGTLIDFAAQAGWLRAESIEQLAIGEISLEGDRATAVALAGGIGTAVPVGSLSYRFVREDGVWRFRFAALVHDLGEAVAELTGQLEGGEDELIFLLVETFTGREVLPEIWQPPRQ